MARKQSKVTGTVSPSKNDNFILIKGIGPAIATQLYESGIHTYRQLAATSTTRLASRVKGKSAQQIAHQDWIGQARKLASKKSHPGQSIKEAVKPTTRQHYENFTIEFLLDEKNALRRTRVLHVQSGDADTWVGWEDRQLMNFLARHAGVHIPAEKVVKQEISNSVVSGSQQSQTLESPALQAPTVTDPLERQEVEKTAHHLYSQTVTASAGVFRLVSLTVVPARSGIPMSSLMEGDAYSLRLTMALSDPATPIIGELNYKVVINIKQLGGQECISIESSNTLNRFTNPVLNITGPELRPGIYRLDAFASLLTNGTRPDPRTYLKGDLLQVY